MYTLEWNKSWLFLSTFFVFAIQAWGQTNTQESDWELDSRTDVLEIYTRPSTSSKVKEVRIVAKFDVRPEAVQDAIDNVNNFPSWVFKCNNAYAVDTPSENETIYYASYDMPFPVSDRDIVVSSKRSTDEKGRIFYHCNARPELVPKNGNKVRVTEMKARWMIEANPDGSTAIDYRIRTSVGGNIPAWLVNLCVTSGPKRTMTRLAKVLREKQRAIAAVSH